jgi:hypothetical protein
LKEQHEDKVRAAKARAKIAAEQAKAPRQIKHMTATTKEGRQVQMAELVMNSIDLS